ncbi:zinc ribbon domain-containing protein [Streptomyces sp. NPDC087659]|uniref:zinc ribbon domain-containing protein n=1 Tax=Streptomyces sp. NPDC087659 TaxID=3365801 RepID=UPI00382E2C97
MSRTPTTTPSDTEGRRVASEWTVHDADGTFLRCTHCRTCDTRWFPPRDLCSTCASSEVEEVLSTDTAPSTPPRRPHRAPAVSSAREYAAHGAAVAIADIAVDRA